MAKDTKIWVGPGVLRAVPGFKGEKKILPGHEIPKGFVSADRIKQLEKRDKICSESAYTKGQAASGVVPVVDAAGKIKTLELNVKQLETTNKELTAAVAESTNEAAAVKIEELEATIVQLEETDKAQKAEIATLEDVAKVSGQTSDDLIKTNDVLLEANQKLIETGKSFEIEIKDLNKALKEATKKGDK